MLKIYEVPAKPLVDESTWDIPKEVLQKLCYHQRRKKCRKTKKKKRIKGCIEIKKKRAKTSYELCGQQWHNKRLCKNVLD